MADRVGKHPATKPRTSTAPPSTRPFQCQWHEGCPKSFNRKSDLQRHYRIHTNERPYACDYKPCEKTFIQRSALTVHRRTHTGDKPHKCPYTNCGKCFSDSSSLARHRRIHTNDKPYICKNPQCRKAFCRKTTMTKHFRKEHPAESLDHEEDADYSDVELSEEEPPLEQDATDSPSSVDYVTDHDVKLEATSHGAASNYNANLWRLPAQTAQRATQSQQIPLSLNLGNNPLSQTVKLERSASHTSQPHMATAALSNHGVSVGYSGRANTFHHHIPRSHSGDLSMWQAQQHHENSHSMSSEHGFPATDLNSPVSISHPFQQVQTLPIRRPSLQPVHDIILDEPQQSPFTPGSQQNLDSGPTPQYAQGPPDFRDDMPPTPAPGQQMPQFSTGAEPNAQYQEPQALPMDEYNHSANNTVYSVPSSQGVSLYMEHMDPYKELKFEDSIYNQMPEATYGWR